MTVKELKKRLGEFIDDDMEVVMEIQKPMTFPEEDCLYANVSSVNLPDYAQHPKTALEVAGQENPFKEACVILS